VVLDRRHGFLTSLSGVHAGTLERAQLLYANYPNNPTGAVADRGFWRDLVEQARRWDFVICSDLAYSDIVYEGRAVSVLEVPEARPLAVESITFSKSYNMQGWRLSAMVGSADILSALYRVESQINSGVFNPIQSAGVVAMQLGPDPGVLESYRERRQILGQGLAEMGLRFEWPKAAVYFWVETPAEQEAEAYARHLLHEGLVAVTPGTAFGPASARYIRVAFTSPLEQIVEGLQRWQKVPSVRA
jgi:LL-diaminopimelate aminotransferase